MQKTMEIIIGNLRKKRLYGREKATKLKMKLTMIIKLLKK